MSDSPDLYVALKALIDDDPTGPLRVDGSPIFDPRFPRCYLGAVHPTTIDGKDLKPIAGYVLVGLEIEDEQGFYNGEAGQTYFGRVHLWGLTPGDARRMHHWYKRLVHGTTLVIDGYQPFALSLSKVGPTPDEGRTAWQVEVTQRGEPIEQAA